MTRAWSTVGQAIASVLTAVACISIATPASAQEPPPRVGPFVLDIHGTVPRFPDTQAVADSRGISIAELPGSGIGVQLAAHVYFLRVKAVTFGVGAEAMASQASQTPPDGVNLLAVTERFRTLDAQLSLNFGGRNGWSYVSGGIGQSIWSIVPEGQQPVVGDDERLKTINYGGGARWFAKRHLAFSFDVRFYAINPGTASFAYPGTPRTTLMSIGAGISLK